MDFLHPLDHLRTFGLLDRFTRCYIVFKIGFVLDELLRGF